LANIHWGGFASIKNVPKGRKHVYNGADRLFNIKTLKFRNSEITRFEYVKSIAFKFRTRAGL